MYKSTIAVVGSGEGPKDKGLGQEIDSHDIVIRMHDQFPTPENEIDLGKKWTWLATSLHPGKNGIKCVHYIKNETIKILCIHSKERFGERIHNIPIEYQHLVEWMPQSWADQCQNKIGYWPTSGAFLLYWLLKMKLLKNTTVYGIDGFRTGYYEGGDVVTKAHNMQLERPFLDLLISQSCLKTK